MNGLTKLGTILTVVFLVSLLALVAQLIYVLWRRQTFRRRSDPLYTTPSKEQLLYLFCWKNQSRIEPAGKPHAPASEDAEVPVAVGVDDDDVAKWQQAVYGPSRVLFTIKEEEREETNTTSEEAENEIVKSKTVSFDQAESVSEVVVVRIVEAVDDDEATPFSSPCGSSPYYTPSPSPTHDKYFLPVSGEAEMILKGENDVSFVSLEVKCV